MFAALQTLPRVPSQELSPKPSVFSSLEDQTLRGKCFFLGDDHPHRDPLAAPGGLQKDLLRFAATLVLSNFPAPRVFQEFGVWLLAAAQKKGRI